LPIFILSFYKLETAGLRHKTQFEISYRRKAATALRPFIPDPASLTLKVKLRAPPFRWWYFRRLVYLVIYPANTALVTAMALPNHQ
jgi:hypothetical protein